MDEPDLQTYREWMAAQGFAISTIRERCTFLERCCREWGSLDQSPGFVAGWLSQFGGWTRRTYQGHLNSVYSYLVERGHLAESPIGKLRRAPEPTPRPSPLSVDELDRVVDSSHGHLRTWLLLGYLAGLRCHEIAKIRGEDISSTTLFVRGKGGQDAMLPTHPDLWAAAQEYPRSGWWFPSVQAKRGHICEGQISTKIRDHLRAHGIDRGSIHRLRHTYLTSLHRNGVQTRTIQVLARHRSLATTQMYLDVVSEERDTAVRTLLVGSASRKVA